MNKIVNIGLTALFACFVAACENDIDNYDAPNGGVYGTIYDKVSTQIPFCLKLIQNDILHEVRFHKELDGCRITCTLVEVVKPPYHS